MILESLTKLSEEWICDQMKDLAKNRIEPHNKDQTKDDQNRKIMTFVGSALSLTIKNYNKCKSVAKISEFLIVICICLPATKSKTSVFHMFVNFEYSSVTACLIYLPWV